MMITYKDVKEWTKPRTNVGNNALNYDSPDWGAVGSVRVTIPTAIRFIIDGRYNWGFSNLSRVSPVEAHTREFQLLAGIDLPFYNDDDRDTASRRELGVVLAAADDDPARDGCAGLGRRR